ncbi:MAG: hypothetical protein NZM25_04895 [Leptospiraceae bacterium]|nr:hypothetical protein [Leptospiraceae bacterium]MDW8305653.1 hypothetical protein [Leptospiraceae bacterium]
MTKRFFITLLLYHFLGVSLFCQFEEESWRFRPQIGLWFGPVTPFPGSALSYYLDTNLGGGIFWRMNLPSDTWRSEVGTSYSYYDSRFQSALHTVPVYGAVDYLLPIELPLTFYAKLGFGAMYVFSEPNKRENWHPLMLLGYEASFPAGKWVNIGARIDYFFVYEGYLRPPPHFPGYRVVNAHLLKFGLMVNFNLSR